MTGWTARRRRRPARSGGTCGGAGCGAAGAPAADDDVDTDALDDEHRMLEDFTAEHRDCQVPSFGEDLPSPAAEFPAEHALSRRLLTLPCDHRYDAADMARVADMGGLARYGLDLRPYLKDAAAWEAALAVLSAAASA
mgnify:CR=1 FL=1